MPLYSTILSIQRLELHTETVQVYVNLYYINNFNNCNFIDQFVKLTFLMANSYGIHRDRSTQKICDRNLLKSNVLYKCNM